MAGTTPEGPSRSSAEHPGEDSLLESELRRGDRPAPVRRGLPVWLLPTLGALAVGLLVGYFVFGGTDAVATRSPAAADVPSSAGAAPHVVTALVRAEPVQVDIPAIEVSSSLVDLGLNGDGTLEVPVDFAKAGWFTGGNFPGDPQGPPALIAGHVDDYSGPAVFYRLTELVVGDEVHVIRADNTVAVFSVTQSQQFPKDQFPAEQVYAPVDASEIVLITCTGEFNEDARSYRDNYVVRAALNMERSLEESDQRAASGQPAPSGDQANV